jgi:hypothetical protein
MAGRRIRTVGLPARAASWRVPLELRLEAKRLLDDAMAEASTPWWFARRNLAVRDVIANTRKGARCWVRRVHRAGNSFGGPCRNWSCTSGCALDVVADYVLKVLEAAGDQPVAVLRGEERWARFLDRHGAPAWLLKVPSREHDIAVFVPHHAGLVGVDLVRELVGALLDKPVEAPQATRKPPANSTPEVVTVPPGVSDVAVRALVTWRVVERGPTWIALERPTEEQWAAFVRAVRDLRAPPIAA